MEYQPPCDLILPLLHRPLPNIFSHGRLVPKGKLFTIHATPCLITVSYTYVDYLIISST